MIPLAAWPAKIVRLRHQMAAAGVSQQVEKRQQRGGLLNERIGGERIARLTLGSVVVQRAAGRDPRIGGVKSDRDEKVRCHRGRLPGSVRRIFCSSVTPFSRVRTPHPLVMASQRVLPNHGRDFARADLAFSLCFERRRRSDRGGARPHHARLGACPCGAGGQGRTAGHPAGRRGWHHGALRTRPTPRGATRSHRRRTTGVRVQSTADGEL